MCLCEIRFRNNCNLIVFLPSISHSNLSLIIYTSGPKKLIFVWINHKVMTQELNEMCQIAWIFCIVVLYCEESFIFPFNTTLQFCFIYLFWNPPILQVIFEKSIAFCDFWKVYRNTFFSVSVTLLSVKA